MAALIEIMRALAQSECKLKYTLIAVALDLEEYGVQGGTAFVQDFLVEALLKQFNFPRFQVIFVLHICVIVFWTRKIRHLRIRIRKHAY